MYWNKMMLFYLVIHVFKPIALLSILHKCQKTVLQLKVSLWSIYVSSNRHAYVPTVMFDLVQNLICTCTRNWFLNYLYCHKINDEGFEDLHEEFYANFEMVYWTKPKIPVSQ